MKKGRKRRLRKFLFEFLSIFIAVISAFALSNWNDNRKDSLVESKILLEIRNGLEKDREDVEINLNGHKGGIRSCKYWRSIINGESQSMDTLASYYLGLTRDFTSIQNTSGYETLKSKGFEIIENDSLRAKIISLYEFDYQTLRKLEEEYHELQFQENYYTRINDAIAPNFVYDEKGNMFDIRMPIDLEEAERNIILSYLWKIQVNRRFIMNFYEEVKTNIDALLIEIDSELNGAEVEMNHQGQLELDSVQ